MNKQTCHHFEEHAGHSIEVYKEHVRPQGPVSKTGEPLKGGIQRYCWVGFVDDDCIANKPVWQGGTKDSALAECRSWAEKLHRTAGQTAAVIKALGKALGNQDWFPIAHFVAELDDLSLETNQLVERYLAARQRMANEIGIGDEPGWHEMESEMIPKDLYLCRCDCGNEMLVGAKDLTSGAVKSCGCQGEHYFYGMNSEGQRLVSSRPLCKEQYKAN